MCEIQNRRAIMRNMRKMGNSIGETASAESNTVETAFNAFELVF